MISRRREAARGLGALLVLLLLLVAPPIALALLVGWPLPSGVPSLSGIGDAAQSGIDDIVIVKVLALIGWVAWAQVAAAIALEAVALLQGRRARSVPAMHGIQVAVGQLLAMVALLFGTMTPARAATVPLSSLRPAAVAQPLVESSPPLASVAARPRPAAPQRSVTAAATYVVQPLDSWWGVAEDELGDGRRWQELRSLNVGRAMPDGRTIEAASETIYAGWVLRIPDGESAPTVADVAASEPVPAAVTVTPGDNLWDLAEADLEASLQRQASDSEIAPHWQELIDENSAALVEPDNPSLIVPGQVITFPGPPAPSAGDPPDDDVAVPRGRSPRTEPGEPASPPPTDVPSNSTTSSTMIGDQETPPSTPLAERDEGTDGHDDTVVSPGALGVAGTLLASGISAAVWRRRRRREQTLPRGARVPDPPPQLDGIRAEIMREADPEAVDLLARALACAARDLAARHLEARVRLVQAGRGRIEILLSESTLPAPEGWHPEASGLAWVLDDSAVCPDSVDFATHPALVSVGRCENSQIYLDLEAEGLVSVTGEAEGVADIARSFIAELSTSPGAGASVILCGSLPGAPAGEADRVRKVEAWDEVADDVLLWATQTRDLLAANRWSSAVAGRAVGGSPDLLPTLLFVDEPPEDDRFDRLCAILGESLVPVAIVAVGSQLSGATGVEVSDGELRIPILGLRCEAQALEESAAAATEALFADAERVPAQLSFVDPDEEANDVTPPAGSGDDYSDPPFEILVRVLGNIEVVGGRQPLGPKQTAVVSYVALHSPVTAERIEDGVWSAPTSSRRKRLANTISEARQALGAGHLPPSSDGKYRVGSGVTTDLDLFERRIAYAKGQTDAAAIETLRGALDLVSGPVFTYRNTDRASYVWVDLENWISSCELSVTEAAEDLAARYVEAGDLKGAIWAARKGLSASPTHARLTAALMQAHIDMGDDRAAAQVYQSHVSALERMDIDEVAPELIDVYQKLSATRVSKAAS